MSFVDRGSLFQRAILRVSCLLCKSLIILVLLSSGCSSRSSDESNQVLTLLSPEETGISFKNTIREHEGFNVLEYEYFFNGGGVAIGDLNNDGLPDVYFTANMEPDHLYLNKGNLSFENISLSAGLTTDPGWTTGVSMADVNADGWLDIYVCRSGQVGTDRRRNLLYINNGDLTFSERAAEFGLDEPAYSNHASFFDYDRDGDLDMYLLNHPIRRFSNFDVALMKQQRDSLAGDKLFRNTGGHFEDVSVEAGIIGNALGFGLSAVVSDINQDGWPDLYVANDYIEDDYLYINRKNGTFSEEIKSRLTHASYSSMGSDIADINNDGLPDIMTLDMLAEDHYRQKILKGPENHIFYQQMRERGIHEQYMRNMLQLNNGNGTFSEIGQLAGVSNTDWSWAVLLADFDNNSYRDIIVTNGYLRDYTDLDYLERVLGEARRASAMGERFSSLDLVQQMPSTPLHNYAFSNRGGLDFENRSEAWNFQTPSFSNGAAYGDLDLDGDLDLIINNINEAAFVYRNNTDGAEGGNHLRVQLEGPKGNPFGYGSTIEIKQGDEFESTYYVAPARGYLSSVDPVTTAGLGALTSVDLTITWPDGKKQELKQVEAGKTLILKHEDGAPSGDTSRPVESPLFYPLSGNLGLDYVHQENPFYDFDREPLLPHMLSRLGPALAVSDMNRDRLEDIFVGGARGQAGALYLQQTDGSFSKVLASDLEAHAGYEDVDAAFIDIDNDGDNDLYVVSGGNDETELLDVYQDRVYLNNGFGIFSFDAGRLPEMTASGSTLAPFDYDADGDIDVFVGGGVVPGRYPRAPRSYLLENEGGFFKDVTLERAEALVSPGMVMGAAWADLDGTGQTYLILAGEWMNLRVFVYDSEQGIVEKTTEAGFAETTGWWNTIEVADLDGDGDADLLAGNQGLNTQLNASIKEPLRIYADDMDANGKDEIVLTNFIAGQRHSIYWREELVASVPRWSTIFPDNKTYASADIGLLKENMPPDGLVLEVTDLQTSLFENVGDGTFRQRPLPPEAQFSPVNDIVIRDVDGDGILDVLMAGNDYTTRPQIGPANGGRGLVLMGKGRLDLQALSPEVSGLYLPGDARKIKIVHTVNGPVLVAGNNNGLLSVFGFN